MKFQIFLALLLTISIWIPAYGAEYSPKDYWKMNLGDDITIPNVVEESLLGLGINKNFEANNANVNPKSAINILDGTIRPNRPTQVYAQPLSKALDGARRNRPTLFYKAKGSNLPTDDSIQFFFEKHLVHPGSKMKLNFFMNAKKAKFMPLEVSNSIPFSTSKLPEILHFFAVKPKSAVAELIEETLWLCEYKPIKGEQKLCATSLESMVDYVKSRLGKQLNVLSTEVKKATKQEYKIENAEKLKNEKNMVCHKMVYPYAVFYCHTLSRTDIYKVSLVNSTGKKVKAIAVCHKDTSPWYPGHVAFQVLKVKPGSVPICHFLNVDAMIWVSN